MDLKISTIFIRSITVVQLLVFIFYPNQDWRTIIYFVNVFTYFILLSARISSKFGNCNVGVVMFWVGLLSAPIILKVVDHDSMMYYTTIVMCTLMASFTNIRDDYEVLDTFSTVYSYTWFMVIVLYVHYGQSWNTKYHCGPITHNGITKSVSFV